MSIEENQAVIGEKLHQLKQELVELRNKGMMVYYRLGEIMKEVYDKELWRESYESFSAFCADSELSFDYSNVMKAIKIVQNFQLEEVVHVPEGKLVAILPYLKHKDKKELLQLATSLSRSDLRQELMETEREKIESNFKPMPKIYACKVCLKVKGVYIRDLCHCGKPPKVVEFI